MKKIAVLSLLFVMLFILGSCSSSKTKEPITEELFRTACQEAGLTVSETKTDNGRTEISATGKMGVYYDKFDNEKEAKIIYKLYVSDTSKGEISESDKGKNYTYTSAITGKRKNIYNVFYRVDDTHIMISAGAEESDIELANKIIAALGY